VQSNASTLGLVEPVGGESFLKELNEMEGLQSNAGQKEAQ